MLLLLLLLLLLLSLSNLEFKTDTYFSLWEESQFSTSIVHIDLC